MIVSDEQQGDSTIIYPYPFSPESPRLESRPYAAGPGSGEAFLLEDRYGSSSVEVLVGRSGLQRTEEPESWDMESF